MLKILKYSFLLLLLLLLPAQALAEEAAERGLNVQINFENDTFYNNDYHYTNGLQIRFITPALNEFAMGQHIYTPKNKKSEVLQEHDRPYAGYLYGAFAKHWLQDGRMDTVELAVGIIGPGSLAEWTQNKIHGIISVNKARGWEHQLENEPALMLTLARIWRLNAAASLHEGWSWDALPRIAASLGNPFTQASASVQLRFGRNLPDDYNSTYMHPGAGVFVSDGGGKLSIYFFAGIEGRALAWNSFLDGNIWRDSHSVDKKYFVAELSAGIVAAYKGWRLAYTHISRSKEFDGQNNVKNYGSVMFGYVF